MKLLQLILALLLGASLWLAYQLWPGRVMQDDSSHTELMGGVELHYQYQGRDITVPANEIFLGLAGVFAVLMVATAVTHRRRKAVDQRG